MELLDLLMKEYSTSFSLAKGIRHELDMLLGLTVSLQEIQRAEKQLEVHQEYSVYKIQTMENSASQNVLGSSAFKKTKKEMQDTRETYILQET